MIGGLLIIPFGLPGLWLMLAVVAVGAFTGSVAWWVLVPLVGLGVAAEVLEFVAVRRFSGRSGGSRRAFWGAIAGGIAGAVLGAPIPVLGPLVGGVAGTFVGAAAVTMYERRDVAPALRVGWGAALGRGVAVAIKIAAALVVLIAGGAALLF